MNTRMTIGVVKNRDQLFLLPYCGVTMIRNNTLESNAKNVNEA